MQEKHARAVFVSARSRSGVSGTQYSYEELVYCERPSIEQFIALVRSRDIVLEFTMSERENKVVRNHGYPWRLCHEQFLEHLFGMQIKLR